MADYSENDEVVQSIRYIRRQRTTKLIVAMVTLVAIFVIGALFVTLAYSGEPKGLKSVPTANP